MRIIALLPAQIYWLVSKMNLEDIVVDSDLITEKDRKYVNLIQNLKTKAKIWS